MILVSAFIACFSIVLPLCASKDPLTWVSVEAQGAYIITDTGSGQKCGAIPNTFEMRADGTWLPSSEFDLTGNFEDDCGLHVSLSIPAESSGPSDPMTEWETFIEDKRVLADKKKELKAKKKELDDEKEKHADEVKTHEKNMKDAVEEEKKLEEMKKTVEDKGAKVKTLREEVKKMQETLDGEKGSLDSRKSKLDEGKKKYGEDLAAHQDKKRKTEDDLKVAEGDLDKIKNERERLKKLYQNCATPNTDVKLVIPLHMLTNPLLCFQEEMDENEEE